MAAAHRPSARAPSVAAVLVVLVTFCGGARARIALPTSDYNAVDTSQQQPAADQLDAPSAGPPVGPSASTPSGPAAPSDGGDDQALAGLLPWTVGVARVLRRVYLECRDDDLSSCLKVQMVRAMDRVARTTRKVALAAGVTLERDADAPEPAPLREHSDDLEQSLPRSLPERERSLDKLILERFYGFLQNYSLRFKLPSVSELNAVGAAGEDGEWGCRRAAPERCPSECDVACMRTQMDGRPQFGERKLK